MLKRVEEVAAFFFYPSCAWKVIGVFQAAYNLHQSEAVGCKYQERQSRGKESHSKMIENLIRCADRASYEQPFILYSLGFQQQDLKMTLWELRPSLTKLSCCQTSIWHWSTKFSLLFHWIVFTHTHSHTILWFIIFQTQLLLMLHFQATGL